MMRRRRGRRRLYTRPREKIRGQTGAGGTGGRSRARYGDGMGI
jgi:hypothetical protein